MTDPNTPPLSSSANLPGFEMGPVSYTVADLSRQVAFYQEILGFHLRDRLDGMAILGTVERELLHLVEVPGARRVRRTTGLYHTAFLVPSRWELAQLVRQIAVTRTPIQGTANHGTHLAVYLPDPEGNGIELAWDFPRSAWPMRGGKVSFDLADQKALDLEELLEELRQDTSPWSQLSAGTRVGHVHLHVSDLAASRQFYTKVVGFDITASMPEYGVLFVSAGGYHHHLGLNTWNGPGAPPPPADAQGLRYFTIKLSEQEALERIAHRLEQSGHAIKRENNRVITHDPSGNGIALVV